MTQISREEITDFIENHIKDYHAKILQRLLELRLAEILKRKNPYLFKAKALDTSQDLVKSILDAHLSSQEEGIFGAFLEELAIFICRKVYNGQKSSAEGIDLEFEKERKLVRQEIKYIKKNKKSLEKTAKEKPKNFGHAMKIRHAKDLLKT